MRSPFAMASVANTPLPWMGDRRAAIFFLGIAWFRTTAGSHGLWPIPPPRRVGRSEDDVPEPGPVHRHAQAERDPEQRLQAAPHAPCDEEGADCQQPAQQLSAASTAGQRGGALDELAGDALQG